MNKRPDTEATEIPACAAQPSALNELLAGLDQLRRAK